MANEVVLDLGEFARTALDRVASRDGGSRSAVVRTAWRYYLAESDSQRSGWPFPPYSPSEQPAEDPASAVAVRLDDETWRSLVEQARRQNATPAALAEHAMLLYLADIESGRVGTRLRDALTDLDES